MAAACGIPRCLTVRTLEELDIAFQEALREDGPWCIVAKIQEEEEELAHAPVEPELTLHRFRETFLKAG